MNFGFAGNQSHSGMGAIIEPHPVNASSAAIPFGAAVILNADNSVSLADATLTAANFAGISFAEVHQRSDYPVTTAGLGGSYAPKQTADVAKFGIFCVNLGLRATTPTAGGPVYIRTVLNGTYATALIGDFEAASDTTNSILLTNATWYNGKVDGNNVALIKLRLVNN
jgi:hypothetical protein